MSGQPFRGKRAFKDYCLILQVHPEADAALIDAAYWHLAKRYNEAAIHDPRAREKLEELNEAYNVLGSPDRREAYMREREAVMGAGALPVPPPPPAEKPPLTIMARQKLRPRLENEEVSGRRRLWPGAPGSVLAIPVVLALAAAAFLAGVSMPIVALLSALGLLLIAASLAPSLLKLIRPVWSSPIVRPGLRFPSVRHANSEQAATATPIDAARLKASSDSRTEQLRRITSRRAPPEDDQPRVDSQG